MTYFQGLTFSFPFLKFQNQKLLMDLKFYVIRYSRLTEYFWYAIQILFQMTLNRFKVVVRLLKMIQHFNWLWATMFSGCSHILRKHSSFEGSNEQFNDICHLQYFGCPLTKRVVVTHTFKICWEPLLIYFKFLLIKIKYSYH